MSIDTLRDFKSGSIEEFLQLVVGEFFAAGAFWVGVERIFMAENFLKDTLFWVCVVGFIAGLIIAVFGLRQLSRRKTRIDSIINRAIRVEPKKQLEGKTSGTR